MCARSLPRAKTSSAKGSNLIEDDRALSLYELLLFMVQVNGGLTAEQQAIVDFAFAELAGGGTKCKSRIVKVHWRFSKFFKFWSCVTDTLLKM